MIIPFIESFKPTQWCTACLYFCNDFGFIGKYDKNLQLQNVLNCSRKCQCETVRQKGFPHDASSTSESKHGTLLLQTFVIYQFIYRTI